MNIFDKRTETIFKEYCKIQFDGKYNMVTEAWKVMQIMPSRPSSEEYCFILRHYNELKQQYPIAR